MFRYAGVLYPVRWAQFVFVLLKVGLSVALISLAACTATETVAPVSSRTDSQVDATSAAADPAAGTLKRKPHAAPRPGHHVIIKGDTLYSIAWRYNLDYRDLARWNGISAPYVIYLGQMLRITPPPLASAKTDSKSSGPSLSTNKKTVRLNREKVFSQPQQQGVASHTHVQWSWPTAGMVVKSDSPVSKRGINIAGQHGQIIKAAAMGTVVYSGSGLLGYGKLIIIRHNNVYLSAYAHNSELLVQEGDKVKRGQQISLMGSMHGNQPLLYFEIRKGGRSVDPLKFLPKKVS